MRTIPKPGDAGKDQKGAAAGGAKPAGKPAAAAANPKAGAK